MFIHEAASSAAHGDLLITRSKWAGRFKIKPTDGLSCCEVFAEGRADVGKRWNPALDDLIANDWMLVS